MRITTNASNCGMTSTRGAGDDTERIGADSGAYSIDQVDNITNSAAGARAIR